MIWEQNSVVVVSLTRLTDNSTPNCHRYWPEEGTELYHIYEVDVKSNDFFYNQIKKNDIERFKIYFQYIN